MTISNAGSMTKKADIFHPSVFDNGITAQKEGEADSAVITDAFQRNEEDDGYISKSDLDTDDEQISEKPQISERRRNQNKTFMSWFVPNIGDTCTRFLNNPTGSPSEPKQ